MSERIGLGLLFRSVAGRASTCIAACLLLMPQGSILAQAPPEPAVNASAGARVFGEKGCVKCHAVDGRGGAEAPDLARNPKLRSFYDLASDMWNHGPEMVRKMEERGIIRPRLTSQEAGDLIAFLYTLDYFDPPGDPEAGQAVFTEKKCALCHQVGGVGGVIGPDLSRLAQTPSPIQVAAAMWNHGPAMSEKLTERGLVRPTFTGSELINLIAYLRQASPRATDESLYILPGRAAEGRRLFAERQCEHCHGSPGRGGGVGPDLTERASHRSLTSFAASMWNKQPAMIRAMRSRGVPETRLEADEMADLVAYLYSLRYFADSGAGERGRQLIRQKGCLACHALDGQGGSSASDLSETAGLSSPSAVIAALWNHTLIPAAANADDEELWPVLRPGEMADLSAFLQSRESQR